ncbi:uncharacterized protein A4U43_C07F17100 [Asparagus officinalis]|uniref:Uncharacterized protein n=1 Tax=Asparagus officinalis TaxID=4686 RepID=A0A5P1ECS9_ASPOF|nr:uncharacterized protein A4U43_C07F17100 [Asparagus officinalis]
MARDWRAIGEERGAVARLNGEDAAAGVREEERERDERALRGRVSTAVRSGGDKHGYFGGVGWRLMSEGLSEDRRKRMLELGRRPIRRPGVAMGLQGLAGAVVMRQWMGLGDVWAGASVAAGEIGEKG